MRDEARIDSFLDKLNQYWHRVPDWRFGQLITNVFSSLGRDPFYIEEDEMLRVFENYFNHDSEASDISDSVRVFEIDLSNQEALAGVSKDSAVWYPIKDMTTSTPYVEINNKKLYL